MNAFRSALRHSILTNDYAELATTLDRGRALGMNHYDLLEAAEAVVPGLGADEWADRLEEVATWES
jgi:hypothetical protein